MNDYEIWVHACSLCHILLHAFLNHNRFDRYTKISHEEKFLKPFENRHICTLRIL